jgi:hypothetical protein
MALLCAEGPFWPGLCPNPATPQSFLVCLPGSSSAAVAAAEVYGNTGMLPLPLPWPAPVVPLADRAAACKPSDNAAGKGALCSRGPSGCMDVRAFASCEDWHGRDHGPTSFVVLLDDCNRTTVIPRVTWTEWCELGKHLKTFVPVDIELRGSIGVCLDKGICLRQ